MENENKTGGGFNVYVYSSGNNIAQTITQTINGNVYNGQPSEQQQQVTYSDEEIAQAISSINGKDKVLNELQKWMGVCIFVQSRCGYPRDLKACCEKLAALPYDKPLEVPCYYDNVRKLAIYGFARLTYDQWPGYKPIETEKKNFASCFDVASELEAKLTE